MTEMIRKALLEAETYIGDRSAGSAAFWDALDEARKELDALSSVPEDVARDAETVRGALSLLASDDVGQKTEGNDALSRLATAAARVPGLEAELSLLQKQSLCTEIGLEIHAEQLLEVGIARAESAESERDAARQEAERLQEEAKDARAAAHSTETIASDALKEVEALRANNAMLEKLAERERNPRCQRQECARTREAMTAGDEQVKTLTARVAESERELKETREREHAACLMLTDEQRAQVASMPGGGGAQPPPSGPPPTLPTGPDGKRVAKTWGESCAGPSGDLDCVLAYPHRGACEPIPAPKASSLKSADRERVEPRRLATPTPAPAGLLEAVGPTVAISMLHDHHGRTRNARPAGLADVVLRLAKSQIVPGPDWVLVPVAEWQAFVAAYDAAKGGEAPRWSTNTENYEAVASVLREAGVPEEMWRHALAHLRDMADDGKASAMKARKWDEAVERLDHERGKMRADYWVAAHVILTGDTPPSGPGGGGPKPEDTCGDCGQHVDEHHDGGKAESCEARNDLCEPSALTPEATHREPVTLGQGPFTMLPDVAARSVERTHRAVTEAQRPVLTPESLAAVVEAYIAEDTPAPQDVNDDTPPREAYARGQVESVREVLRRALSGQVPRVIREERVVEVLETLADEDNHGREEPESAMAAAHSDGWTACALEAMKRLGVEDAQEEAGPDMATATHHGGPGEKARERRPEPTPEAPALTGPMCDCGKPATCFGRYEAQTSKTYACDDCCGHGNEDGSCKPVGAKPEPAVPDVAWEGDGVRVFLDGTARTRHGDVIQDHDIQSLARALAEAKLDARLARASLASREEALRQTDVALAEAKRERQEFQRVAVRELTKAAREAARAGVADTREKCARIAETLGLKNLASVFRAVE